MKIAISNLETFSSCCLYYSEIDKKNCVLNFSKTKKRKEKNSMMNKNKKEST